MADVISRSISTLPYAGGTLQNTQPFQSAVRLTDNRMIWTWCQTTPDWRFFTVVDTPEGWANGGNPVATVNRMFDQRKYFGVNVQMVRLNDNAFMIADATSANSSNWALEIFEIDTNNQFTRTYSNLDAYNTTTTVAGKTFTSSGTATISSGANTKFGNTVSFIPLQDNKVLHVYIDTSERIVYQTMTYDPVAKTITLGTATTTSSSGYAAMYELTWKNIPGSTKKAVTVHSMSSTGNWTGTNSHSLYAHIFNADGTLATSWSSFNAASNAIGNGYGLESVVMSETRMARLNWANINYYKTDGTSDGFAYYFNTSTSNNALMAYALDANYLMLIDRTHFATATSGDLKVKIVRREDSNITTQSTGSGASATGFTVTAPWIDTWRHESRPIMLANGDLFWWGLDSTGLKLTWNILKNAA